MKECDLFSVRETAKYCVILCSDFANVGELVFFSNEEQAQAFASEEGGRVVDEHGLVSKFESMHCAEGRIEGQSANGRFVEIPEDEDPSEYMDQYWSEEYQRSARDAFKNAVVYGIVGWEN